MDEDENEEDYDDECDNDDTVGGGHRTNEEKLQSYITALCRGTRNATVISLKRTMSQHNAGSRSSSAVLYKKLCFFAQVARWHLKQDNNNKKPDEKALREKALQYYDTYKYHFNIQSDDMFEGVHVTVVDLLEHIYKTQINVYEIYSLKKRPRHDRVNPKRETFANKYRPVIQPVYLSSSNGGHVYKQETLLLHNNHYYTISNMNKLTTLHYRCISCGQICKGHRMSVIKKHIQEQCGKIQYRYRRGAVEPHKNMWEEAKHMFSIPDDILNIEDEDMLYTGYYATYDFEAMLHKENVADLEYSATSDVMVYDEHGEPCIEQEYLDRHEDEAYIIVN